MQAIDRREHELDLDYGAWQLLRETLQEAEAEDAVHLGKALVDPITKRIAQLTGGRYGNLLIGPKLETEGIELGGTQRALTSLSVGTQEQLATVLPTHHRRCPRKHRRARRINWSRAMRREWTGCAPS